MRAEKLCQIPITTYPPKIILHKHASTNDTAERLSQQWDYIENRPVDSKSACPGPSSSNGSRRITASCWLRGRANSLQVGRKTRR